MGDPSIYESSHQNVHIRLYRTFIQTAPSLSTDIGFLYPRDSHESQLQLAIVPRACQSQYKISSNSLTQRHDEWSKVICILCEKWWLEIPSKMNEHSFQIYPVEYPSRQIQNAIPGLFLSVGKEM